MDSDKATFTIALVILALYLIYWSALCWVEIFCREDQHQGDIGYFLHELEQNEELGRNGSDPNLRYPTLEEESDPIVISATRLPETRRMSESSYITI